LRSCLRSPRVVFAVEDLDDTLTRLKNLGAAVVDEVVDYQGIYKRRSGSRTYSSDTRSLIRKGTLLGVRGSDTVAVLGKDGTVACASVRGGIEPLAPDLETFIREDLGRVGVG
jgi:hypothetical protein